MTPEHRQKRQSRELKQTRKGFSIKKRLVTAMCNVPFIRDRGLKNALDIQIREFDWQFSKLPDQANDLRILHLSDTHLDGVPGLLEVLKDKIAKLDFDIAVLTGDYRFDKGAFEQKTIDPTLDLINFLQTLGPVYAVPGNHDCLDTIEQIEKTGAHILINQHVDYKGITIAGVDDPHYFETHDLEQALHDVPKENFKLLLAHSPESSRKPTTAKSTSTSVVIPMEGKFACPYLAWCTGMPAVRKCTPTATSFTKASRVSHIEEQAHQTHLFALIAHLRSSFTFSGRLNH